MRPKAGKSPLRGAMTWGRGLVRDLRTFVRDRAEETAADCPGSEVEAGVPSHPAAGCRRGRARAPPVGSCPAGRLVQPGAKS